MKKFFKNFFLILFKIYLHVLHSFKGTFNPTQLMDIIGQVADRNPTMTCLQVINTLTVQLSGCSDPIPKKRQPKYNPGTIRMNSKKGEITSVLVFIWNKFSMLENT